ncbi:MAG: transposase [Candidatus Thiodiazotropha sp. (ex Lucinoma aequizonata)]|nr:transposase [Candidatus Thiodiazotropha sp. (ex Lucinoma aequizonata)]MCU7889048.1 transposase [Candidatus Thiodiazotropha sp. (ex Lucinoma aequizonata)]MCU7894475.1 transposase [Candidatus Thiodiazotropha sp. (ex Lucinoma aequizonata)]MCU7899788.1 transposase [Candidatus Thiodiazotropha sp. (ex Lucinoma aequizonata)]MCU7902659.1 transposase [Candidatus Thiodiazotropha sp. (ex Lucinoma aequizonata)]
MATRRKYSKEFKLDASSLLEEQGYATTEVASSLGIRPELIRRWICKRQADDGQAFRGNGKRTPEQEEIKKLKTKMKCLKMEKEILKKSDDILCSRNEVKYSFITQQLRIPVQSACNVRFWV